MTRSPADRLLPRPRELQVASGVLGLERPGELTAEGAPDALCQELAALLRQLERTGQAPRTEGGGRAVLASRPTAALAAEAYELDLGPDGLRLAASDAAGLRHGLHTLRQWSALHPPGRPLPAVRIRDRPDFPVRGVMLDVSRDKVPTLATLRGLVDRFASWKLNQLQLYVEHTFAYAGHERVWKDSGAYTPDEIRALDDYCHARGIELVPNQNSLGHMHRWLVHEPYRQLAECPAGVEHPFSRNKEPFSLCPTDPRSLSFVAELFDQLLPCFRSTNFNVGLDETFDIGQGRSAADCAARGKGRVYAEYLQRVHALVSERGRRMLFWGDVILEHPELIPGLPRDAVALEWGYEAEHPFQERSLRFAASGLERWVCPGTSSWNSLGGRLPNATRNLAAAATAGRAEGARGLLVTDWGDHGHLQPLPISYPGFLMAAALSWNADDAARDWDAELPELLDRHVLGASRGASYGAHGPRSAGAALCELGRAYRETGVDVHNAAAFFLLLHHAHEPLPHPRLAGLCEAGLHAARAALRRAADALPELTGLSSAQPELLLAIPELGWVAGLMDFTCELGTARLAAGGVPTDELPRAAQGVLGERLRLLIDAYDGLWLRRNRPGGLDDSRGRLERVARLLVPAPTS